jgi:hypothetical protein
VAAVAGTRARAGQVVRRPRLLLLLVAIGALLALATTLIGFSSAAFTASSIEPSTITAGGVQLALAPASEILDGTDLAPGVTRTGTIEVTNTLSASTLVLGIVDLQQVPPDAGLDSVLDVVVRETSPSDIVHFDGKLGGLHGVPVGTVSAGAGATYEVTISWPEELDDPVRQGATASFAFEWQAVST